MASQAVSKSVLITGCSTGIGVMRMQLKSFGA
jgi:hypothetical protein